MGEKREKRGGWRMGRLKSVGGGGVEVRGERGGWRGGEANE